MPRLFYHPMIVMPESFTAKERDLIRVEFMIRGLIPPSLQSGIHVPRWGSGPNKGKPKLSKAVQSMLDRGLVEIVEPEGRFPFAKFTAAGIEALREMSKARRFLPPEQYWHLIEELENL
jgi:hypothetical protein